MSSSVDYYIRAAAATGEAGPYTINQLRTMWNDGRLTKQHEFRYDGTPAWIPLAKLIHELEPPPVMPVDGARAAANRQILFAAQKKSGLVAALLNLVIPGVGYMYCGRVFLGIFVFFLVVFLLVVTVGFAGFIIYPILVIDGVLCAGRANKQLAAQCVA